MNTTGQGIDIGDAVMHFIADTTQLDLAFDKTNDAGARLEPAKVAVQDLSGELQGLGSYWGQAGESSIVAGEEMAGAAQKAEFNMAEAKGEIALLGEEVGIRLPRHVRTFVAELPGVGVALESAFAATAALFLIQAIVEGTKRLSEWIAATFIYTEAQKEVEKQVALTNKVLLDNIDLYKKAKDAVDDWGKNAVELTRLAVEKTTASILDNEAKLRAASDTIYFYNHNLGATKEEAQKAGTAIIELNGILSRQREELLQQQLIAQKAEFDAFVLHQAALQAAAKLGGDARINLEYEQERTRLLGVKNNYLQEGQLDKQHADELYALNLKSLQDKLTLLQMEGDKTKNEQIATQAQIRALTTSHLTELLKSYNDFMKQLKADRAANPVPLVDMPLPKEIVSETQAQFDAIHAAAATLGVSLGMDLYANVQKAKDAFLTLKSSGVASVGDIMLAYLKLNKTIVEYDKLQGLSHAAEDKEITKTQDAYDKFIGKREDALKRLHQQEEHAKGPLTQIFDALIHKSITAGEAMTAFGNVFAAGIGQSVSAALMGSENFDQAMQAFLKSTLSSLAGQATVQAIVETAKGFAAMSPSNPDFGHSGEHFTSAAIWASVGGAAAAASVAIPTSGSGTGSSGGGGTGAPSGPNIQAPQSPVQSTNVARFATGALVTGPTLAMIGDSAQHSGEIRREAAIPLDDPQAVKAIVQALGGGGGPRIALHINGLVSPDNLNKVVGRINRMVNKGQTQLVSSNAYRVTKRSQ